MKKLLIFLFIISLAGCGTLQNLVCKPGPIITPNVVAVDPKLLEPCKPIPVPTIEQLIRFEDTLYSDKQIISAYKACADKNDAAIIVIKKFSNNP
jgi:hypothetical protein